MKVNMFPTKITLFSVFCAVVFTTKYILNYDTAAKICLLCAPTHEAIAQICSSKFGA